MLSVFFNPKSIALIGASERKGSVGLGIAKNLLQGEKKRKVFFVNPYQKKILGKRTYSKIISIEKKIDLAIIAVPAVSVPLVIKDCVKKKVKGVIIISSGFAESGKEGKKREEEIVRILKSAHIPLLGPNCLGIIRPSIKLNASFSPLTPKKGEIAFISQSGALIDSIIDKSLEEGFGFSVLVSYGNEADINLCNLLEYLKEDKESKAIALYLEGIKDGKNFIKLAQQLSLKKPIVVLKGGKTFLGKKAAFSHSGALIGNPEIYSAAFKKGGIFEVETIRELFEISLILAQQPPCRNGIGILTNGGGVGVLSVDWIEKFGIKLVPLSQITKRKIINSGKINSSIQLKNPLDILGDASSLRYKISLEALLSQKNIEGVIVIQTLQIMTEVEKNANIIIELKKKYPKKPIITLFLGGKLTKKGIKLLRRNSIPCFSDPKEAALGMKALIWRRNFLK